jgi:hypothetical protein
MFLFLRGGVKMGKTLLEDDFIISSLACFAIDLQRGDACDKAVAIDKCACILTAYMQGQIKEALKRWFC